MAAQLRHRHVELAPGTEAGGLRFARAARGRRAGLIALLALLAAMVIASGIGSVSIPPGEVVKIILSRLPGVALEPTWPEAHATVLWSVRLPRVVMGALVGMALAVAGCAYQGLFENPLADPYVLGVSSGSGLGAALVIAGWGTLRGGALGAVPAGAFVGGLLTMLLVYSLASTGSRVPRAAILLAGVAVGSLAAAFISLVVYFTSASSRDAIIFWMMGGLGGANWVKVLWLLPYLMVGMGILLSLSRELNALLMGEEEAWHLGVDVERVKKLVLVASTLLTAASVAFCGSIGFVGMIVPHLVRMLVGPDHRYLLPVSALVGGVVLVLADALARSLLAPAEIPVGLVMAVAGGPFFLWLLRRRLLPQDR
ncbi:MAG TPA: iron ABC transporter permease [Symbiobacteriaceae bacterium]